MKAKKMILRSWETVVTQEGLVDAREACRIVAGFAAALAARMEDDGMFRRASYLRDIVNLYDNGVGADDPDWEELVIVPMNADETANWSATGEMMIALLSEALR